MDALKGFWQLALEPSSRPLTAFTTIHGLYQWKVLPMGLKTAPSIWQYTMDHIFRESLFKNLVIYIDDLLVYSQSFAQHLRDLDAILTAAETKA
jgi:hypothetical protein